MQTIAVSRLDEDKAGEDVISEKNNEKTPIYNIKADMYIFLKSA